MTTIKGNIMREEKMKQRFRQTPATAKNTRIFPNLNR